MFAALVATLGIEHELAREQKGKESTSPFLDEQTLRSLTDQEAMEPGLLVLVQRGALVWEEVFGCSGCWA